MSKTLLQTYQCLHALFLNTLDLRAFGSNASSLRVLGICALSLILASCGFWGSNTLREVSDRFTRDAAPPLPINPDTIHDAVPRKDPVLKIGNKNPYTVRGKTYHLLSNVEGYRQQGIASWYGAKFQGRKTSNGEIYSLYAMTAAHKTLPLPSYVKVTNLENAQTVIVRVNDRGPFVENRLIDLSLAAATKLGYASQGTTRVEVEIIDVDRFLAQRQDEARQLKIASLESASRSTSAAKASEITDKFEAAKTPKGTVMASTGLFIQAGAFKSYISALDLKKQLQQGIQHPVLIEPVNDWFRVRIGPIVKSEAESLKQAVIALELGINPVTINE